MPASPRQFKNPEIASIVASQFYRKNAYLGIEYADLEQEAAAILWKSETDGRYDPCRASLATHSTICVTNDMLTFIGRWQRRNPDTANVSSEVQEWMPDSHQCSPEDAVLFLEMLRQLPEDARTVVQVVLGDPSRFGGLASRACKRMIGEALGWSTGRLRRAFRSIESMLDPAEA